MWPWRVVGRLVRVVGALLTLYHAPPKMHARQLPDTSVVKAARCQRARGQHGVLRLRKVEPFHWFKTASAPCPLIVLYMCVCPWRLALQKEGLRQQMDEIRAVRTVAQLLVALSRSQKWGQKPAPKTGPQYYRKRKGFQNGGPISRTRVLHTQSAPLCVQWVAETSEHFVCFPANWLDKASSKSHSIWSLCSAYVDPC